MVKMPSLGEFTFRGFDSDRDPALMAEVINASNRADGLDDRSTPEQIANDYRHTENCDLSMDVLMAEHHGDLAGYTRTVWWQEVAGPRVHAMFAFTHPRHRAAGLHEALLDWSEARGAEVAATDGATEAVFEGWAEQERQKWLCDIYESRGFEIDTYGAAMVRHHLDEIGEVVLPDGVEIRKVVDGHLRAIWEASAEAFRDHYAYSEPTEADYGHFLEDPKSDPSLWQVAWAGDQVVGQVRTFIDEEENAESGRLRGYTEDISTARQWRKQGIAGALIRASLHQLKSLGFTEAALGVHTENPNGAFQLYESLGYGVTEMHATYRKPMAAGR